MTGRVEEDAKLFMQGLNLCLSRAKGHNGRFARVEVVDIEVEVGLLRLVDTGPQRRPVIGSQLERKARPTVAT